MDHVKELQYYPGSNEYFTDAVFTIITRRKALYPMSMLILPNLILAGLTILVFVIPIDSGKVYPSFCLD